VNLFESTLLLLFIAAMLLQLSRRAHVPYPTILAFAGACLGALQWGPTISIEPRLALALFIAPALLDAAYDLPPRELYKNWVPMVGLALVAVIATAFTVAILGTKLAGLPFAAAITLGAIVAPPDAAAANAVLRQFELPRRTLVILQGESLLNDAVALLIFGVGVSVVTSSGQSATRLLPQLLLAVPGAILLGLLSALFFLLIRPLVAATLTGTIMQFAATFGVWIVAEHLKVSPILTIVVYAMTLAHYVPDLVTAKERVHSYAVWEAVVFVLNVLAFLLMGLQIRAIVARLQGEGLRSALLFAGIVLAAVIVVRAVWVMVNLWISNRPYWLNVRKRYSYVPPPVSYREGILISWCGMRGLVTIATALALPNNFPGRDLVVLTAFAVVLGTLVIQGTTIHWLIRILRLPTDRSIEAEVSEARAILMRTAINTLDSNSSRAASAVKAEYEAAEQIAKNQDRPQAPTEHDELRLSAIAAQRKALSQLRHDGKISDDAFHRLEEELDWSEMSAAPRGHFQWLET
jgi:monovalent cation/hydrogen antiporter